MKVRIIATMAGKVEIAGPEVEVKTLADLSKLAQKTAQHIAGVKRFMPSVMDDKVEKLKFTGE